MNYTVYDFYTRDEIERSLLIALLSDNYFDGFEETSETLQAYVPDEQANDETVVEILTLNDWLHIRFEKRKLEHKNWNEEFDVPEFDVDMVFVLFCLLYEIKKIKSIF